MNNIHNLHGLDLSFFHRIDINFSVHDKNR